MTTPPPEAARKGFTLGECNALLPLVRSISAELIERRREYRRLRLCCEELERSHTPEGLTIARDDLRARMVDQEDGILSACKELGRHGLSVRGLSPLVLHFPGPTDEVVFCWREDEPRISHQHTRSGASEPDCEATGGAEAWPGAAG